MRAKESARAALREATAAHHRSVDDVFSRARLDERDDYARFLRAQAAAHIPVEQALGLGGVAAVVPDWDARRRGDLLRADLADLGCEAPAPARAIAFRGEAALLGALYVLEGSRLGGALLRRSVAPGLPVRFLGGSSSPAWRMLLKLLDERLGDAIKRGAAIDAAREVFALFEASGRRYLRKA